MYFEEYQYYAAQTRAEEDGDSAGAKLGILATIFPSKNDKGVAQIHGEDSPMGEEKDLMEMNLSTQDARRNITDTEWTNASRALRVATWPAVFYLITTDILGPFGLP